jgi:hypothetical protein
MYAKRERNHFGPVQVGIVITALTTAFIHWYLILSLLRDNQSPVLFFLNGLGYLSLLAALFLPQAIVDRFLPPRLAHLYRPVVRYVFIGYTILTITLWYVMGPMITPIALVDKAVEITLVVLLWLDRGRI